MKFLLTLRAWYWEIVTYRRYCAYIVSSDERTQQMYEVALQHAQIAFRQIGVEYFQ